MARRIQEASGTEMPARAHVFYSSSKLNCYNVVFPTTRVL